MRWRIGYFMVAAAAVAMLGFSVYQRGADPSLSETELFLAGWRVYLAAAVVAITGAALVDRP